MKCSLITFFIYSVLFLLSLFVRTVAFLSWIFMILFILKPPKICWYAALLKSFWQNGIWREVKQIAVDLIWSVLTPLRHVTFSRWQPAQRPEWDGERRPCLVPAVSARAGSLPSGVWTLPQRKRQKPTQRSARSVKCSTSFQNFRA